MSRLRGLAVALLSCFVAVAHPGAARGAQNEGSRLDVALTVLSDGSVAVEERHQVQFGAKPESTFARRAPAWRHDGVFDLSAFMDGKQFLQGTGVGEAAVRKGPALDVTWRFPPASNTTHVFLLKYRAAGAIEVSGIRGTLAWRLTSEPGGSAPLPACITITLPAG